MELQRKELIVSIHMENEVCSETTIELVKLQETTETRKTAVLNCYSQDTSPNYDEFVHNVTLDTTVLDGLISKCFLTIEDREEIMNQRRLSERNKMILNILMTRPYRTFQTFTEELIEFDRSKMDLVSKMKNFDCDGDNRLPFLKIMDISSHKIQLQKNFKMLVNELATTNTIVDHLISEDVLCSEDQAEICASDITKEQSNRLLLTKLMYKNAGACRCFLSALKEDTCDETLARRIEHTDVTEEDKIMLHIGRTTAKEKKEKYTRGSDVSAIVREKQFETCNKMTFTDYFLNGLLTERATMLEIGHGSQSRMELYCLFIHLPERIFFQLDSLVRVMQRVTTNAMEGNTNWNQNPYSELVRNFE